MYDLPLSETFCITDIPRSAREILEACNDRLTKAKLVLTKNNGENDSKYMISGNVNYEIWIWYSRDGVAEGMLQMAKLCEGIDLGWEANSCIGFWKGATWFRPGGL